MGKERGNRKLKFFDKIIGSAILFFVGLLFKKRLVPAADSVKRVAFIKTAAIGDTVLLGAMTEPLKERFPDAVIYLFTGSGNFEIAKLIEGIDYVVRLSVTNPFSAVRTIRRTGKFDVVIDFGSWPRIDALLAAFSRSACSIGFKTENQFRHYAYDIAVDHRNDRHELCNYLALLKPLGIKPLSGEYGRPSFIKADSQVKHQEKMPYVIFHLFPGGTKAYLKEWPVENWIKAANFFIDRDMTVLFTGSTEDRERAAQVISLLENRQGALNIAGKHSIKEVIALLSDAELIITVNTGIMHIAAALNTPMIALHGPTNPERWGPSSEKAVVVTPRGVPCAPCLNLGFEYSGCGFNRCMRSISAELVIETVGAILAEKGRAGNVRQTRLPLC